VRLNGDVDARFRRVRRDLPEGQVSQYGGKAVKRGAYPYAPRSCLRSRDRKVEALLPPVEPEPADGLDAYGWPMGEAFSM
jgi:hypothetical protein